GARTAVGGQTRGATHASPRRPGAPKVRIADAPTPACPDPTDALTPPVPDATDAAACRVATRGGARHPSCPIGQTRREGIIPYGVAPTPACQGRRGPGRRHAGGHAGLRRRGAAHDRRGRGLARRGAAGHRPAASTAAATADPAVVPRRGGALGPRRLR